MDIAVAQKTSKNVINHVSTIPKASIVGNVLGDTLAGQSMEENVKVIKFAIILRHFTKNKNRS